MLLKKLSYLVKAFGQSGFISLIAKSDTSFATLFWVCSICNDSKNNKILTQQNSTIFSQFLKCSFLIGQNKIIKYHIGNDHN